MIEGFRGKSVLVVCPHTDDELGCAGTVVRLVEGGARVRYVALSRCEESVPPGFAPDALEYECRVATERMGIRPDDVTICGFKVRHFPAARQEILETLVAIGRKERPDLVIVPSSADRHQDHATTHDEAFRAFKYASIWGYEVPHNNIDFRPTGFVALTEELLAKKLHVVSAYASQTFRGYGDAEVTRALAVVRGAQSSTGLAEAFEVIRLIV